MPGTGLGCTSLKACTQTELLVFIMALRANHLFFSLIIPTAKLFSHSTISTAAGFRGQINQSREFWNEVVRNILPSAAWHRQSGRSSGWEKSTLQIKVYRFVFWSYHENIVGIFTPLHPGKSLQWDVALPTGSLLLSEAIISVVGVRTAYCFLSLFTLSHVGEAAAVMSHSSTERGRIMSYLATQQQTCNSSVGAPQIGLCLKSALTWRVWTKY